jgi:hypothetical protein
MSNQVQVKQLLHIFTMYNYALSKEIYTQYLDNTKIRNSALQVYSVEKNT